MSRGSPSLSPHSVEWHSWPLLLVLFSIALLTPGLLWLLAVHPIWLLLFIGLPIALSILVAAVYLLWTDWPRLPFVLLWGSALLTRLRFDAGPVTIRPAHLVLLGLLPLLLLRLYRHRRSFQITVPGFFAIAWWLFLVAGAFFNAPNYADTLRHQIRMGLMVATYLLTVNLIREEREWQQAWRAFLLLAALEASFGLFARVIYPNLSFGVQVASSWPVPVPYGTLEEGNIFGSSNAAWSIFFLTMLTSPLSSTKAAYLLQSEGESRWASWRAWLWLQRWWLLGALLTTLALLFSLSRAAWVAFVVVFPLLWLLVPADRQARQRRLWWAATAIIVLALPVWAAWRFLPADWPLLSRLHTLSNMATDPTFSGRIHDWTYAYTDWKARPLIGWGPGTFVQIHGQLRGSSAWIANLTVRAAQESGILGLIAVTGFALSLLGSAAWRLRRIPLSIRQPLLGLALSFVVLLIAYQSTDGSWLALPWIHAALLYCGTQFSITNETDDDS